jgi:tryptophanyl-tRNA synthetase
MVVTPWEVRGKVDYERLIREFGNPTPNNGINPKNWQNTLAGFICSCEGASSFSHRDLDVVLDLYEKGIKICALHWPRPIRSCSFGGIWFHGFSQNTCKTILRLGFIFQMTDDEKFLVKDEFGT